MTLLSVDARKTESTMPKTQLPPGPPGHWLTGNVGEMRGNRLAFFNRCAEFGDISTFRLGHQRLYMVSHPDLIERVLVSENRNFKKHYVLQLLRPMLGNGLLLSEREFWLRQRRLMQPAFSRQSIEAYAPAMVANSQRLMDQWKEGQTVDIHHEMERLALWIAVKTLLNVDMTDELRDISQANSVMMEDFNRRFETALPLPRWLPTPHNLRARAAMKVLDDIVLRIISERRAGGGGEGDLLSILLNARDEDDGLAMTDRQLRDEVMTMFMAGHETTANVLTWTWWLLANHPEVEAKLCAELEEVLAGRSPNAADLPRLTYAERIIKESMRLYPPAFALGRQATAPCVLGGYQLPAGATVLMSQWVTHRDPRWFDDPLKFDPDRWTEDFEKTMPRFGYFPFGGGPRTCIGNGFAMMETMLVLAAIAPRFRFDTVVDHPVEPWPAITLRPKHGIKMVVKRRGDIGSPAKREVVVEGKS